MINRIARIRRLGWRMKPIRRWYGASNKSDGAEFENVLRGEMEIVADIRAIRRYRKPTVRMEAKDCDLGGWK